VQVAVFAIYFTLPAVALSALPVTRTQDGEYETKLGLPEEEGGFAGDPILGVVKAIDLGPLQGPAELYVGVLAATILLIATNAGLIGVSRLVYSMGVHRQLPDRLRRLHPRYGTPWVGILLFGGHRNVVQNNNVYGNYLVGIGAIEQFVLKQQDAAHLEDNQVIGNQMGLGGNDLNGRDLFYDGSGKGNCFQNNATTTINEPQDNSVFAPCPGPNPNSFRQDMRDLTIKWATDPPEQNWIRHPHAAKAGYNALEHWTKSFQPGSAVSK